MEISLFVNTFPSAHISHPVCCSLGQRTSLIKLTTFFLANQFFALFVKNLQKGGARKTNIYEAHFTILFFFMLINFIFYFLFFFINKNLTNYLYIDPSVPNPLCEMV